MINSNEQALLTYLEEQMEQTQSQIIAETTTHNHWASGEWKTDLNIHTITDSQVDFYITNSLNRIKPLQFRLKWLQSEIENFNFFKNI